MSCVIRAKLYNHWWQWNYITLFFVQPLTEIKLMQWLASFPSNNNEKGFLAVWKQQTYLIKFGFFWPGATTPAVCRWTLRRSRGWVQQAAPAEARPPKYHLPIRFVLSVVIMSRMRLSTPAIIKTIVSWPCYRRRFLLSLDKLITCYRLHRRLLLFLDNVFEKSQEYSFYYGNTYRMVRYNARVIVSDPKMSN